MLKIVKEEINSKIKRISGNKQTDNLYHLVIKTNDKALVEKLFYLVKLKTNYKKKKEKEIYHPSFTTRNEFTKQLIDKLEHKLAEEYILKSMREGTLNEKNKP